MNIKENLYEPVINFRELRPQMSFSSAEHNELYEKAFFSEEDTCQTEYAQNTTTWD